MRFDLSAVDLKECSACEPSSYSQIEFQDGQQLSFSFTNRPAVVTVPTRRLSQPAAIKTMMFTSSSEAKPKCSRADDPENDQYSVRPGVSMCWSVLCKNDTGRSHPGSLLGDFGHIERLSSWVHLLAGIVFFIYAVARPFVLTQEHTAAESLTTLSAWSITFAFFSSAIYHVTSPSKRLSRFTRQLDYFAIYLGLASGYVADFAIATKSFQNTSILAIVDGPIACAVVAVFFFVRRCMLSSDETWDTFLGGCTLSFGLMRRMHVDRGHTGVRQSTSFLLSISYFVTVPLLYDNFGTREATTIFILEIMCMFILLIGMILDNKVVQPDSLLSEGRGAGFLACKRGGCVGNAHSIWHILSVIAAVKSAMSREYALTLS